MPSPIVRVSIGRCSAENFDKLKTMMIEAESALRPGIEAMTGCLSFFAGVDEATLSLSNVSLWKDLASAKQMENFEPMLALGRKFVDAGAHFERPIMNYTTVWEIVSKA